MCSGKDEQLEGLILPTLCGFFFFQMDTSEADGFQADTEDDDEFDCVVLSVQSGKFGEW